MKALFFFVLFFGLMYNSKAQVTKVSLQASGLTCSMCSKAVMKALDDVSFVDKVDVDIKSQKYNLSFKEKATVDFDVLKKAVEDAGFSVASFLVTVNVDSIKLEKDSHLLIGNQYLHFLNAKNQQLSGNVVFIIVDKKFVSDKQFKKYSATSKMECVQTGRAGKCCAADNVSAQQRVYHAII